MSNVTIAQIKDDLIADLHLTSINKIRNFNALARRAGNQVLLDIDPFETIRVSEFNLYDQVYDYSPASDLKGDKIIDIRPQGIRDKGDNFTKTYIEEFDLNKKNKDFTLEIDDAVKILRVRKDLEKSVLLHDCDSTTANGTWAADGGASGLAADTIYKQQGSASLNFDIGAAGGYIENSTMTSNDLTDHENQSSLFVWIYIPDSSLITNFNLRWGSGTGAYWHRTVTTPHFGTAFKNGWNLLRFDWNGATKVGSPVVTAIDTLRFTVVSTSSDTDIRLDAIYSRLPVIYEQVYYSKLIFRDSASSWTDLVTDDNTILNLDVDSYQVYLTKLKELASRQLAGEDSSFDYQAFRADYIEAVKKYKAVYPSQKSKAKNRYWTAS